MGIRFHTIQGIGRITLDQPPSNIMTLRFFGEFRRLVETLGSMHGIKAIVISGNGRHFSSGADISELLECIDEGTMTENYKAFVKLEHLDIPVISAIRGVCLGSAFELALFSHFRICSQDAVLGLPESSFNLMPGIGGAGRTERLAGKAKAIELALRGNTFTAEDALEMGLVDAVVPKRRTVPVAEELGLSLPPGFRHTDRKLLIYKYLKPLLGNE